MFIRGITRTLYYGIVREKAFQTVTYLELLKPDLIMICSMKI